MPADQLFTDWVPKQTITHDLLNTMKNNVLPLAGGTITGDFGTSWNLDPAQAGATIAASAGGAKTRFGWNRSAGKGEAVIITEGGDETSHLRLYRRDTSTGGLTRKLEVTDTSMTVNGSDVMILNGQMLQDITVFVGTVGASSTVDGVAIPPYAIPVPVAMCISSDGGATYSNWVPVTNRVRSGSPGVSVIANDQADNTGASYTFAFRVVNAAPSSYSVSVKVKFLKVG